VYSNQFWQILSIDLPGRWGGNPIYVMLSSEMDKMRAPVDALGDELKGRIDEIPTQAQRDAAEARIEAAFAAKGLKMEEMTAAVVAQAADEGSDK
jgi:hypothetical protein